MKNFTFEFIDNLLKEVKSVFSDPFIHLGMDEGILLFVIFV